MSLQRDRIEMSRHGKAVMPWGEHKGVRIRIIPDAYLSWLTTTWVMTEPKWWWLKESLLKELRARGLRADLAEMADDVTTGMAETSLAVPNCNRQTGRQATRRITFEEDSGGQLCCG